MVDPKDPDVAEPELGAALDFLRELWRLNHALERLSARMERELGITAQQRLVLRCLVHRDSISAGGLAELMHLDPGTVSAALRRMEAKGLVRRSRPAEDRRRVVVTLSARGRTLARPAEGTVEHAVARLIESLSAAESDATRRALTRLTMLMDRERAPKAHASTSRRPRRA
ncbi:MAG: MarR family transcriptional regulator [Deltaproteobacteria bacterium]|nr:MarR family transcriptional regulator [Deltaproteobacteria bacterium]